MTAGSRRDGAVLVWLTCLGLLTAAATPGARAISRRIDASLGDAGWLALLAALGTGCWFIALRRLALDPVRGASRFAIGRSAFVAAVGLGAGGYGAWLLVSALQRHVTVVPAAWLTVVCGAGTGMAALWGVLGELGRRRYDGRAREAQALAGARIRDAVAKRRADALASERLRRLAFDLARSSERSDGTLSPEGRGLARDLRRLGAEVARALMRLAGGEPRERLLSASLGALTPLQARDVAEPAIEDCGRRLIPLAVEVFERAGPPRVDLVSPAEASAEGRATAFAALRSGRAGPDWRRQLLGLDSELGPRLGAAPSLHLLFMGCLALTLMELPNLGIDSPTSLWVMAGPLLLVALADGWVTLRTPATPAALVSHLVFGGLLYWLLVQWWTVDSARLQGPEHLRADLSFVGAVAFLPGWWIGTWLLRLRAPYPPHVAAVAPAGATFGAAVFEWRGRLIAAAWRRWLRSPIVGWLNNDLGPVLERTALTREVDAVMSTLLAFRDAALGERTPAEQLRAATAVSTLHALVRWQHGVAGLGELLDLVDDNERDELFDGIERIVGLEESTIEGWLERFSTPADDVDSLTPEALYSALSRGRLHPPAGDSR